MTETPPSSRLGSQLSTLQHGRLEPDLLLSKAFLYFDVLSHAHLVNEMSELIDRLNAELSKLKRFPKNKFKQYSNYFKITQVDSGFEYSIDVEKVDKIRRQKGFYLIFTTRLSETSDKRVYPRKTVI